MKQMHARAVATLLWLKVRWDQLTNRRHGRATFFVCLVLFGTFALAHPAEAQFETIGNWIVGGLSYLAEIFAQLLAKLIVVVLEALIPVMLYNNFTTAPVVVQGWALVRDTVNMFFVIVLIIIAFGTIFGHEKFQWQTQVPRLLLFAIVINFSKTLAGIMIDFGQVIMLTFANALREIAAGNIIELFGLNKVTSFSSFGHAVDTSASGGISSMELLMARLASVFILAWVFVIMLLMFVILLYRIVALWILIVVAPLAWFAGGAKILGSGAYKDWWEKFKCLVAIGPIITFFLWLALAVSGAGSAADGFESGTIKNSANFLTEIFDFKHFMSLVIGSALLMAGMDTAQNFCSSMKGSFLNKQLGKAVAFGPGFAQFGKGLGLKGFGFTGRAIGKGARATGRSVGRVAAPWAENKRGLRLLTKRGRATVAGAVAGKMGSGLLGKTVGRTLQGYQASLMGARSAEIAKAGEKYKNDSNDQKASQLNRFAKTGGSKLLGGDLQAKALFKDMIGNKDLQKTFEESGGDVGQLWKRYGKEMENDFAGDSGTLDKLKKFKKRHAHITNTIDPTTGKNDLSTMLQTKDDLDNLSVAAMNDPAVQARMKNMTVNVQQGKKGPVVEMNGMAAAVGGHLGAEKQKVVQGQVGGLDVSTLSQLGAATLIGSVALPKVADVAEFSLKNENLTHVNQVISGLIDKHDRPSTSQADRGDIAATIKRLSDSLTTAMEKNADKPRFVARAATLQKMVQKDFPTLSAPPTTPAAPTPAVIATAAATAAAFAAPLAMSAASTPPAAPATVPTMPSFGAPPTPTKSPATVPAPQPMKNSTTALQHLIDVENNLNVMEDVVVQGPDAIDALSSDDYEIFSKRLQKSLGDLDHILFQSRLAGDEQGLEKQPGVHKKANDLDVAFRGLKNTAPNNAAFSSALDEFKRLLKEQQSIISQAAANTTPPSTAKKS